MLRVERATGKLVKLAESTLSNAGLEERSGLQELILNNAEAFFEQECLETLFILKEEVEPSNQVGDRIDLLAIDSEGRAVVVELKRGNHKLQLLQSLTYAAMIADWGKQQFESLLPKLKQEAYREFESDHGIETVNEYQRIILVAESFDFEVLRTAEWLTDSYGLNITCYQLSLAQEGNLGPEYLSVVQLFPPRQLATQARRRGSMKSEQGNKFAEIEELLESCTNADVVEYFQNSLNIRRNRRRDSVVFPATGKMRFRIRPKGEYARASQLGRFDGDVSLWQARLSDPLVKVRPTDLRFRLKTKTDIEEFLRFVELDMPTINWLRSVGDVSDNASEDTEDDDQ